MSLFTAWTTPKIYTLSLHDALPISAVATLRRDPRARTPRARSRYGRAQWLYPPRPVPRPDAPSREDHPVRPLGSPGPARARPPRHRLGLDRPAAVAIRARLRRGGQLARRPRRYRRLRPHGVLWIPQVRLPLGPGSAVSYRVSASVRA